MQPRISRLGTLVTGSGGAFRRHERSGLLAQILTVDQAYIASSGRATKADSGSGRYNPSADILGNFVSAVLYANGIASGLSSLIAE